MSRIPSRWGISPNAHDGFTSGPFNSLKKAMEEVGRKGDYIYEIKGKQSYAVMWWDRIGWVELEKNPEGDENDPYSLEPDGQQWAIKYELEDETVISFEDEEIAREVMEALNEAYYRGWNKEGA